LEAIVPSLRLLEAEDAQTLDPIYMVDEASVRVGFEIYEGLSALDPDNRPVAGLASRWDIADGGRRYTFHLRPDARFHSGRPVTAESVRWSWERALDARLASPLRFLLRPLGVDGAPASLSGVTAPDEHTLQVELPQPASEFLTVVALPPLWVIDRQLIESDPAWASKAPSAGSGPYRLTAWERGKQLTFEAARPGPRPNAISIEILRDAGERLGRVRDGRADLAHGIPGVTLLEQGADAAATITYAPGLRTAWLGFNLERAPASDPRFRQALAQTIDRDRLADLALVGRTTGVPSFAVIPPAIPGHQQRAYGWDPARARTLWRDAGAPSPIAIWFSEGDLNRRVAQELAAQFRRELNASVELHPEAFSDFIRRRSAGEFAAFLGGWTADYPHPRSLLEPLMRSGAQFNDFRLRDPEVDRLIAEGNGAGPERLAPYQEAERRILGLAALVPLYSTREGFLVSSRLKWPLRPDPWAVRWDEARQGRGQQDADMEAKVKNLSGGGRSRSQGLATVITLIFADRQCRCRIAVSRGRAASD